MDSLFFICHQLFVIGPGCGVNSPGCKVGAPIVAAPGSYGTELFAQLQLLEADVISTPPNDGPPFSHGLQASIGGQIGGHS